MESESQTSKDGKYGSLRLRLITRWKTIQKTIDLCEKLENKLRRGEINSYFLAFSMEKFSLGVRKKSFPLKIKKGV